MTDGITTVAGIEIPSTDPVFLSIVAIHIPLGILSVVAGAIAMLSAKAPGRHPRFGTIYYWSVAAIFASATILSVMRWANNYHLVVLGVLAFGAAHLGRAARRRRWRGWPRWHISAMGSSYVLLLTAFYVDNGKQLPLWKELPVWTYWACRRWSERRSWFGRSCDTAWCGNPTHRGETSAGNQPQRAALIARSRSRSTGG